MVEAKTEENVKLQSDLEETRLQFQETKESLMKECEEAKEKAEKVSVVQEVQVIDNEMVNKLTAENEQLKASEEAKTQENAKLQSSLEEMKLQLQETEALLLTERETTNRTADQMPVVQEVKVTDQEKVNEPTAQNELPKDEAKTTDAKLQSTMEAFQLQLQSLQEVKVDHEIVSKLAAENLQFKDLVSSLEKEKEDARKQAIEAESKVIELKTENQRLNK
nr:myosin-7 isoform X6 [Ipomoea batatas]